MINQCRALHALFCSEAAT